jgi:predicted alpha-1,2-mannosidase
VRRLLYAFLVVALLPAPVAAQSSTDPVDYVDPMIGTLGSGFVFPGPAAPFGMMQLSPDTDGYFAYTGYLYSDHFIRGFSHHHIESMGVKTAGDVPFMPTVGPVTSNDPRTFWSKFDHANEHAEAGYYRVLLESYGIVAELTAGMRVGMHRYTFPPTTQANVILDVGRSNPEWDPSNPATAAHEASLEVVNDHLVVGTSNSKQGYDVHFAAEFDRPFGSFALWDRFGQAPQTGDDDRRTSSGVGAGGYVTFDTTSDRDVLIRVGISFVSRDNALLNLTTEKPDWDFEALRETTRAAWNDALSTIEVRGGTDGDKTSFYTALYHAQHHPNIYTDVNGEYRGHDEQVHVADDHEHYVNFSLWDTYRGENQLLALIQPARYRDMMLSLLDIYEQAGRLPQWALNDEMPDYMVGDPVQPTIVDGYCRGVLDGTDLTAFYDALRHQAFEVRRNLNPDYLDQGWVANGPSETLEYALADFALAVMADSLGHTDDRDVLLQRARSYLNVLDPETRFVRPRGADGSWASPYFPESPQGFVEGTGWQYTWLVPHDLRGLFDAMGGDELVRDRLDTFFSTILAEPVPYVVPEVQKHITLFGILYAGNQYAPSNEHDLHAPYLYDYVGEPHKTQAIVRGYQGLYRPTPDGLPGNDDLGSLSAWYVWSALGFYPVTAGVPVYVVGSPVFEEATIRPAGGHRETTVSAPGSSVLNKYVQSANLGDASLERPWFTHSELVDAGSMTLAMGSTSSDWGSAPESAPPSMTSHDLDAFGCPRAQEEPPEPVATTLTYVGAERARGRTVELAARLSTVAGEPVVGRTVTFEIAGQTLPATTGADGVAQTTATVPGHGRSQEVLATWAGDEQYLASSTSAVVHWGGAPS